MYILYHTGALTILIVKVKRLLKSVNGNKRYW